MIYDVTVGPEQQYSTQTNINLFCHKACPTHMIEPLLEDAGHQFHFQPHSDVLLPPSFTPDRDTLTKQTCILKQDAGSLGVASVFIARHRIHTAFDTHDRVETSRRKAVQPLEGRSASSLGWICWRSPPYGMTLGVYAQTNPMRRWLSIDTI